MLGPEDFSPVRIFELLVTPLADGSISGHDVEVDLPVTIHEECIVVLIGFEQAVQRDA